EAVTAHFSLNAQTADLHTSIPQDVELSVPPELEFADLLRWAFSARYNILEDDRLLRTAATDTQTPIAAGFDGLRKSYRIRRELRGSAVSLNRQASQSQLHLMKALGCLISQAGD
ncbi:MAG: hypothetical protein ACI9J0_004642, partial [Cryomorphaceae bacterium]